MEKNWFVKFAMMETEREDFDRGVVGETNYVWSAKNLGLVRTLAQIVELIRAAGPDVPDAREEGGWIVFEDGRLDAAFTVDVDNMRVDQDARTMAQWKHGKIKLWDAHVYVMLIDPQTEKPGKASALAKQFKIPTYD